MKTGHLPVVLYLVPWCFVVLAAIKLKHQLLAAEGGGYDFVAEVLGVGNDGGLGTWDRLALFENDVLAVAVIGSIAYLGLIRILPSWLRAISAWLICTALFLVLYAQLKSWWEVGTFSSAWLMADGLIGAGRDIIGEYATSATFFKLLVSLGVLTALCVGLGLLERFGGAWNLHQRLGWASWPLTVGAGGLLIASWAARVPPTPFDRAASTAALAAFAGMVEYRHDTPDLTNLSPRELVRRYAALTNAPVPNGASPYFGKARGHDVVFLLLESLPEACYSLARDGGAMPNVSALERSAFVPAAHYSTYPYSRRAYSSIFSSWYPLNGIRGAIDLHARTSRDLRAPGVIHSSALAGYETVAFVPERPVALEEDELRYAALGFVEHEVPQSAYEKPEGFELNNSHRDWVRLRDRQSFDALKARVAQAIDADQRYMYSFNPQVTHGPWPGISASSSREETCRAGFPLFGEVDAMVGELVELLRQKHRLDRTIIVLLGDHGLRTRSEYPPFHAGTLDDVTFHVPLVLYAPRVLRSTVRIPWMTSHIDIAPSVLDLLGIVADRELELGSPMWDPRVADRTTFFFAKGYLGADGYQRSHEAVMLRYLYGGVSRADWNGALRFEATDLLNPDPAARQTVEALLTMTSIQVELSKTMLPSHRPFGRKNASAFGIASRPSPDDALVARPPGDVTKDQRR